MIAKREAGANAKVVWPRRAERGQQRKEEKMAVKRLGVRLHMAAEIS